MYNRSMERHIDKPANNEYPAYAEIYMKLIPADGRLLYHLQQNFNIAKNLILSLPEEKLYYRYANGKWTIKEVLVHIIDDERIYAYRAMCFARNEQNSLPGFEQDEYALYSGANERNLKSILDEYAAVRKSTIALFDGFSEEALLRSGIANGHRATVRALGYHIAGHELHHINLLRNNYLI